MSTGDEVAGMVGSIAETFPAAAHQRCAAHFYHNAPAKAPKTKRSRVAAMLRTARAVESGEASEQKALAVTNELKSMGLREAGRFVREGRAETPTYTGLPPTGGESGRATQSSASTARSASRGRRNLPRQQNRADTHDRPAQSAPQRASGDLAAT